MPRYAAIALARAIDVLVAILMLAATAPLLLTVAAAIRLEGPGPVLTGGGGRLRFRTHGIGPGGTAVERGWLGELLWTARIDELPQFINLLRGDLSLFGKGALELGFNG